MSIKLQSNPFDYRETGEIGEYDYTAAEERARMRGIAKDGFGRGYPDPGRIAPGGGNQVAVSPFDAFVNGLHVLSPISVTVELEPAGEQERIDLIVVRANNTQEIGAAYLDTITGVAGGGVPSPTYNEDVWETPIAKIVRPANSLAITAADITEIRAFAMDADTVDGMHAAEFAALQSVGGSLAAMADYIIEQGVSGIWTYRKWASGIIECWGQTDIGAVGITNTTGNQYYSDTQYLDYPPLANQVDHVSLSAYSDITVYTLSEYWLANSKIAYRLMTGYQVTTPLATRLSAYVIGRWQNA